MTKSAADSGLPPLPSFISCLLPALLACGFEALLFQVYPGLGLTILKAASPLGLALVALLWAASAFLGVKLFQTGLFLVARREIPTVVIFGFNALGFFLAYIALSLLYGLLSDTVSFLDSGGIGLLLAKDLFLTLFAATFSAYGLRIYPGATPARGSWLRLWRPFYDGIDTSAPDGAGAGRDRLATLAKRISGINR